MASFKTSNTPKRTNPKVGIVVPKSMAKPVHGIAWQVLTVNGLRLSCTSFGALLNWRHPQIPLKAVSHNGDAWRSYPQFRRELDRGTQPEVAIEQAGWLNKDDKTA